jgi:ferredoxin
MKPLRRKWGVFVCHCLLPGPFDTAPLEEAAAVVQWAQAPGALPAFAGKLRQAFVEQVLWACRCTEPEALEAACEAVGIAPELHALDLHGLALAVHAPEEAGEKALRLALGTLAALDVRPVIAQNLLTVGPRIALFADEPAGLDVARRLAGDASLVVFVEGAPEAFGDRARGANWGRLTGLTGRLGALQATVAPVPESDFSAPQQVTADQVVLVGAPAAVRKRTGVHRVGEVTSEALERTAAAVAELTGTFAKPELVRYDTAICAGGAASEQACGRCIPACPYDAIARDAANPLRVRVEHLSCEGCGACASACPTSALSFTDPAPESLYARLEAMLAPVGTPASGADAPAVVFHCEQQGRALLEWAAAHEAHYPARLLPVEVPCLRAVSESAMLAALRYGAAGVGLLGCEDCPNGERTLLLGKLELAGRVLEAFGLGAGRVRLLTVDEDRRREGVEALGTFAAGLQAAPVAAPKAPLRGTGNREVLADAIGALIDATGREPGGLATPPDAPYALAVVDDRGCTLCRACAMVCPTHAFAFDEDDQVLRFKQIACVNCGLCASACPERVITLRPELYLEREALDYVTVAQDEMVRCARCDKPYINRRALETIQAKLRAAHEVADTFAGARAGLLTMCPDCRAIAAMLEVNQGWQP